VALVLLTVASFALGWIVAGRFLRPLRTMTATARDISASNLHRRLATGRPANEFSELADTLNDLFARLEASFASQRDFVANASHELRTPLTAERTLLQVALADRAATTEALRAACQDVLDLNLAQERRIDALLTLASGEAGLDRRADIDLAAIAAGAVASREPGARERDLRVVTTLAPAATTGDPNLVDSLVTNLVDNAVRHNVTGGRIEVTTTGSTLAVRNTGPVIPADEVDRLFQPFQRLGPRRMNADGHGLGLAIVRAVAEAHGAVVTVDAPATGGLAVVVTFRSS
jgi:signal transduction histidine kinase